MTVAVPMRVIVSMIFGMNVGVIVVAGAGVVVPIVHGVSITDRSGCSNSTTALVTLLRMVRTRSHR
jgi:hypothetical protein